jgi:hypothetical protein
MLPEDLADLVERLGHPRPAMPARLDVINTLTYRPVMALAEGLPDVGRVLHLIDLMLVGDEEIDWVAAYAALEIIEQDLRERAWMGMGSAGGRTRNARGSGPRRTAPRRSVIALAMGNAPV